MPALIAYHTVILDLGGYIRDPSGLLDRVHNQPFQLHMYIRCFSCHMPEDPRNVVTARMVVRLSGLDCTFATLASSSNPS